MTTESSRPLLLPQNRRLRHLQGIYLRNLTFPRPTKHTIDDAALNKSPSKLEALREPLLQHAQSTDDLSRPVKARRRSSKWDAVSPVMRQQKLEDAMESSMADTFFSLHCEGQDEPVYISEVVEMAMNPNYRFFDLSSFGSAITRSNSFTVKVWARRKEFDLLLEEHLQLDRLRFIGSLDSYTFPANCLVFHLVDGVYASDIVPKPYMPAKSIPSVPSSSYNALMRLATLDDAIQDALATRETLAAQINELLSKRSPDESPQAEEKALLASRYVTSSKRLLKQSIKRRTELENSIRSRKKAIESGVETQEHAQEDVDNALEKLLQCRLLLQNTKDEIHGQRRRICEELLKIYAIEPTSLPLLFTICSLPLPNTSSLDDKTPPDEDVLAAALGYAAQLVNLLQYYLGVPLPYPVTAYGSRSLIVDNISVLADTQRVFPLYPKGTVRFRFDYGVFLLNKDIECLCESQGLKVVDIRHTLPNLKYLLYVCSAGTKDLPGRKAGGVRGLLNGWSSSNVSRSPSTDSTLARKAIEKEDGRNSLLMDEENLMFRTALVRNSMKARGARGQAVGEL